MAVVSSAIDDMAFGGTTHLKRGCSGWEDIVFQQDFTGQWLLGIEHGSGFLMRTQCRTEGNLWPNLPEPTQRALQEIPTSILKRSTSTTLHYPAHMLQA
jgi:hypothetical protein